MAFHGPPTDGLEHDQAVLVGVHAPGSASQGLTEALDVRPATAAERNAIAGLPESSWGGTSVLVYAVTCDAMDLPALPAKAGWPDRWTFNQPGPGL